MKSAEELAPVLKQEVDNSFQSFKYMTGGDNGDIAAAILTLTLTFGVTLTALILTLERIQNASTESGTK